MDKKKYSRENVHSDILAKVIFRIDLAGLTDLKGYINKVKGLELVRKAFGRILPIKSRSINFMIDAQHAENSKYTQEPEIDEGFRFLDCTIEKGSKAVLDIVHDSIVISIDCSGPYSGSQRYTELLVILLKEMFNYDGFVSIRRLGIRKIDKKVFESDKEIFEVFDKNLNLFCGLEEKENVKTRKYYDLLEQEDIRYNFLQQLNRSRDGDKVSVTIDLDAYVADDFVDMKELRDENFLERLLNITIQNQMFEIFKSCVTETYLESCFYEC